MGGSPEILLIALSQMASKVRKMSAGGGASYRMHNKCRLPPQKLAKREKKIKIKAHGGIGKRAENKRTRRELNNAGVRGEGTAKSFIKKKGVSTIFSFNVRPS